MSREEGFKSSYYEATIVDFELSSSSTKFITIIYDNLLTDNTTTKSTINTTSDDDDDDDDDDNNKPLKEVVPLSSIRPIPPATATSKSTSFHINDVVDAYDGHGHGWWLGVVNKVIILNKTNSNRYRVKFQNTTQLHHFHFPPSHLRPHYDYDSLNGKWLASATSTSTLPTFHTTTTAAQLPTSCFRGPCTTLKTSPNLLLSPSLPTLITSPHLRLTGPCTTTSIITTMLALSTSLSSQLEPLENQRPTLCASSQPRRSSPFTSKQVEALEKEGPSICASQPRRSSRFPSKQAEALENPDDHRAFPQYKQRHWKMKEQLYVLLSLDDHRAFSQNKPRHWERKEHHYVLLSPDDHLAFPQNKWRHWKSSLVLNLRLSSRLLRNQPGRSSLPNKKRRLQLSKQIGNIETVITQNQGTPNTQNPEIPLNTWRPSWEAPAETEVGSSSILPFAKSSQVWKFLESSEVFQKSPKKPHFQPLCNEREVFREGYAVGSMINFSNVVLLISKLQYDDPDNKFDDIVEALPELEKHGFNIKPLTERVNKLLSTRRNIARIEDKVKETELVVKECENEAMDKAGEISRVKKKIEELAKKMVVAKAHLEKVESIKVSKDSELVELKSTLHTISGHLESARENFRELAGDTLGKK
ncbi:hypothetical protein ACFE04_016662 [Oxalis oulophora]